MDCSQNRENLTYYFFDMDNDGTPELCITDENRFMYIFKYNLGNDELVLWYKSNSNRIQVYGSQKLWIYTQTSPVKYGFIKLNKCGNVEYTVYFHISEYSTPDSDEIITKYFVTLPIYDYYNIDEQTPLKIVEQAVEFDSQLYYRLTEKQWNELTDSFFAEKEISKLQLQSVKYTFKELFSDCCN